MHLGTKVAYYSTNSDYCVQGLDPGGTKKGAEMIRRDIKGQPITKRQIDALDVISKKKCNIYPERGPGALQKRRGARFCYRT